jgi:transposase
MRNEQRNGCTVPGRLFDCHGSQFQRPPLGPQAGHLGGLDARIIAAHLVEPYRLQGKSGKNDANDAAAICEAASRATMRFVAIKTVAQQGMLSVHRLREGLKQERTACTNRIRGILGEFGLVFAQSPKALRENLSTVIEDANNELAGIARLVIQRRQ